MPGQIATPAGSWLGPITSCGSPIDRVIYSEDDSSWLIPALQQTGSPGTTLGNYIRALLPADRGGHKDFQDPRLVLPQLLPGGGIRPGGINALVAAMPPEFAAQV